MTQPKLHHYVPRFYLGRFTEDERLWVFNKVTGATFRVTPRDIAAETQFYRIPEFVGTDSDALILERSLSEIEGGAAQITDLWFKRLEAIEHGGKVLIGRDEKWWMSLYVALQYLRTAEQRDILALAMDSGQNLSKDEQINLHARLLSGDGATLYERGAAHDIADRIYKSIWMFGRNATVTPFFTSDNPVVVRTRDCKLTLKVGILGSGTHITFPLSPSIMLFCYERAGWPETKRFANHLSPVVFTGELVDGENWGQMFMARRFVMSPRNKQHLEEFGRGFLARHSEVCKAGREWPYDDS